MHKTFKLNRYVSDKLVFLGFLILGLIIARFLVGLRGQLLLSEPIKLNHTGLSISMPQGNAWQCDNEWKYEASSYILSSFFYPSSKNPTAIAECKYHLAAIEKEPEKIFEQAATDISASIVNREQTQVENLIIEWARLQKQDTLPVVFVATVELPYNRRLDIKVYQIAGEADWIKKVFTSIIESIQFEDNQLLKAGGEIVEELKNAGISQLLNDSNRQVHFFIKDHRKRIVGFSTEAIFYSETKTRLGFQSAGMLYMRANPPKEQVSFFQCDNRFDEFEWKSEFSSIRGRKGVELAQSDTGIMNIKTFIGRTEEQKYHLGSAAVPDVFIDFAFADMLKRGDEKVVFDLIDAEGKIVPLLVKRISEPLFPENETRGKYELSIELLDESNSQQTLFFDSQYRVYKRSLIKEGITVEQTDIEKILNKFPERAEFIRKRIVVPQKDLESLIK